MAAGSALGLEVSSDGSGVRFSVRVKPRAADRRILGVKAGALEVRLHAAPADGAANRELEALLAEALGVPKSSVGILRGQASRSKLVAVRGLTATDCLERLTLLDR